MTISVAVTLMESIAGGKSSGLTAERASWSLSSLGNFHTNVIEDGCLVERIHH
jgi:hypothetical protein